MKIKREVIFWLKAHQLVFFCTYKCNTNDIIIIFVNIYIETPACFLWEKNGQYLQKRPSHDIQHGTPYTIEGSVYGKVYCIMKVPFK